MKFEHQPINMTKDVLREYVRYRLCVEALTKYLINDYFPACRKRKVSYNVRPPEWHIQLMAMCIPRSKEDVEKDIVALPYNPFAQHKELEDAVCVLMSQPEFFKEFYESL